MSISWMFFFFCVYFFIPLSLCVFFFSFPRDAIQYGQRCRVCVCLCVCVTIGSGIAVVTSVVAGVEADVASGCVAVLWKREERDAENGKGHGGKKVERIGKDER